MRKLRIVFLGTPDFSVPTLDALVQSRHDVVGVITSVDKYGGRGGKQLLESAVKKYAVSSGIKVMQPKNLKSEKFQNELRSLKADIQVVVAFRMLPVAVWDMPALGTINLHASLLPKYRGAAPINWAIVQGEKETGLTTFRLKHEIDTGDLIHQAKLDIGENETAGELYGRMMKVGAHLMIETIDDIADEKVIYKVQNDEASCPAPKIYRETCQINFNQSCQKVHDFIRGMSPFPGAWSSLSEKETIKIFKCKVTEDDATLSPGTISTDNKNHLRIATSDKMLEVLELQIPGKRKMAIKDLLNGYKFDENMKLEFNPSM